MQGVQSECVRENRRYPRAASRLRCWCEGENVTFYARVGNISEGGMFLRTSTPLERGARTKLRVEGGEGLEFQAEAVVVWARIGSSEAHPGMGLKFVGLDERWAEQ